MGSVLIGARVMLAVVFATAGIAKLLDRAGSRRALADFGVPRGMVATAALLLPLAELATAVALIPPPTARWAAIAALALLLGFIGGIGRAMSRGQAPDCHCFGQLHSAPAGRETLARNAALAAIATLVAWGGPGPALDSWFADRRGVDLAAVGLAVSAATAAVFGLRRRLERRATVGAAGPAQGAPGLPVGASAPAFELPTVSGNTVSLDSLRARGRPVALVFSDPNCGPCGAMYPELGRWQAALADSVTIALVSSGSALENRPAAEEHGLIDVLIQEGSEVMAAYNVLGTPSAVIVTPAGEIASAPAVANFAIEQLIRLTLRGRAAAVERDAMATGSVLPGRPAR